MTELIVVYLVYLFGVIAMGIALWRMAADYEYPLVQKILAAVIGGVGWPILIVIIVVGSIAHAIQGARENLKGE